MRLSARHALFHLRTGAGHAVFAAAHGLRRTGALSRFADPPGTSRILCLHGTPATAHGRLLDLISGLEHLGGFVNARALLLGQPAPPSAAQEGRFLLTFDDGYDNNFG